MGFFDGVHTYSIKRYIINVLLDVECQRKMNMDEHVRALISRIFSKQTFPPVFIGLAFIRISPYSRI